MGVTHAQNAFIWGELDPLLAGRSDVEQYGMALQKARNVWLMPQGGLRRRPGMEFVAEIGAAVNLARLVPFEFEENTHYVIVVAESNDLYLYTASGTLTATLTHPWDDAYIQGLTWAYSLGQIYFFHQRYKPRVLEFISGAWVLTTITPTNIPKYPFSNSNGAVYPGVDHIERFSLINFTAPAQFTMIINGHETPPITYSIVPGTTATNIDTVLSAMPNVDPSTVVVAADAASGANNQWFDITMGTNNGSRYWAFEPGDIIVNASGGVAGLIETTPATKGSEIQEPVWGNGAFAAGTLTLTGNAGNLETVVIHAKTYTFETVLTNVDGHVLIGAAATDSIDNLIAAITLGAGGGTLYAAATTLHPTVTAAAGAGDTMVATAKAVGSDANSYATTETMANGSWGAATLLGGVRQRGWPRCGAFFQGRLWMAGSLELPNYLWASRSGEVHDFDTESDNDDMGMMLQVDDSELSAIHALSVNRHLQLFGSRAEYYIPKSDSEIITPSNASIRRTTQRGGTQGVPVIQVDGATYFIDRSGKLLREFVFLDAEQSYVATNLSRLAGHLITDARALAYRRSHSSDEPDQVFVVDRDEDGDGFGTLPVFATVRDENVAGWSLCATYRGEIVRYGFGSSGFYDVCVVGDEVFCLALRDLSAGGTDDTMYLEKFNVALELDCAKYGTSGTQATGCAHLNGVSGLTSVVDGVIYPITIAAGVGTLGAEAFEQWQVGVDYARLMDDEGDSAPHNARVWARTLPVPVSLQDGGSLNRKRRPLRAHVRLNHTAHLKLNGQELIQRAAGVELDTALPEVTGVRWKEGIQDYDYDGVLDFTQDLPLPMAILSVAQEVDIQ